MTYESFTDADRFYHQHPPAREISHGKGMRSRVKRKRRARRYLAFAVTFFMRPDGSVYRADEL